MLQRIDDSGDDPLWWLWHGHGLKGVFLTLMNQDAALGVEPNTRLHNPGEPQQKVNPCTWQHHVG